MENRKITKNSHSLTRDGLINILTTWIRREEARKQPVGGGSSHADDGANDKLRWMRSWSN